MTCNSKNTNNQTTGVFLTQRHLGAGPFSKLLSSPSARASYPNSTHLQPLCCSIFTTAYFSAGVKKERKKVPKLKQVPFAHTHSVPKKKINPPPHTRTLMETHGQHVLIFFQHADICLTKWLSNFRHHIPREVLKMDTSPCVCFITCVHVHVCRVWILVAENWRAPGVELFHTGR